MARPSGGLRPSLEDVWRWAPLLIFAAFLLSLQLRPHDIWWHLRSGQLTLEEGHVSTVDRFSFTRSGATWINQAWLMQVALYELFRLGGIWLVWIAHALSVTTGYGVLTGGLRRVHGTPAAMLAGIAAFLLGATNMGLRPQSISFVCFGLLICAIELSRQGRPRALRWIPLLFVFWANAHGAVALGGAALGLYVLGRTWELHSRPAARRQIAELWAIGASACAALLVTPQGFQGLVAYFAGFFSHGLALAAIQEFQPLEIRELDGLLFFAVLAASATVLWRSRLRLAPDQLASLVFFAIAALYARRFSVWCGFVLAPVLAAALAERIGRTPTPVGSPARNALYLACVASLLFALPWLHFRPHPSTWIGPDTPVEATAELCRIAPDDARVYQDPGFASYQIFQCPRLRVFTDTRIEFYPLEMWKEFLAVAHGRYDWQEILDRYRIGYLLVPADDERYDGLRAAVAASGRWREIHRDPIAILWTRGEPLS